MLARASAPAEWAPVCVIKPPYSCWQAGKPRKCPSSTHGGCNDCGITSTGAWKPTTAHTYFLDLGLAEALASVLQGTSIVEFGAGHGCYTSFLRAKGLRVSAYDGIEGVAELTHGLVTTADLTLRLGLPSAGWVLAMEVADHACRGFMRSSCLPTSIGTTARESCSPGPIRMPGMATTTRARMST